MENKLKHNLLLVGFGVILLVTLLKFNVVLDMLSNVFDIINFNYLFLSK